jgi:hypothetical protein
MELLRLEYENTIQRRRDADAVMECVHVVLITIAHLAGCTTASVRENLKRGGHQEESPPSSERKAAV